jgi:DNA ligase-1
MIVGSIFPEFDTRTLEVGWRTIKGVLEHGQQTTLDSKPLTISEVHRTLIKIAESEGAGSRKAKTNLLKTLINQARQEEVEILVRIIFREMRIGVNEGMMLEGIAEASDVKTKLVRRALMFTGNLGKVAEIALASGEEGLKDIEMRLFVPIKPMLASMSYDAREIINYFGGEASFEYKLDGARIQIHRQGVMIKIFSRRLSDVTDSLPDLADVISEKILSEDFILEGEAVAIGKSGRPLPFQDLMRRFTRVHNVKEMAKRIPLRLQLFDILYLDQTLFIDEPYSKRRNILEKICPPKLLVPRIITKETKRIEDFLDEAIKAGHEGLMAKRLDSKYTPGARGKSWFKLKPTETLDLVITAADWGYGRRTGWLSNYHLSTKNGKDYLVIGKTFKGLTDDEFRWMTKRLQELKVNETPGTVYVHPELVVEVAFNEIQKSPHYKSGFALRFARITKIRSDKAPDDADNMKRVQELYEYQFRYKGKIDL